MSFGKEDLSFVNLGRTAAPKRAELMLISLLLITVRENSSIKKERKQTVIECKVRNKYGSDLILPLDV